MSDSSDLRAIVRASFELWRESMLSIREVVPYLMDVVFALCILAVILTWFHGASVAVRARLKKEE